jgi:hypothetical protein
MKKFFLIPLMTLVCSVMAFAADQHVSDIAGLKAAIADASVETIYLDADIQYAESGDASCINILRSVTIDGQGHTLAGYGKRGTTSNYPTVAINQGGGSLVDVTLKNLQMINPLYRVVETRGNIHSLTIENCHIEALRATDADYDQPITIGGSQASQAAITIRNSKVVAPKYYPVIIFNPVNLTLENSEFDGYCSVYFKGQLSSVGSRGSVLVANDCHFNAPNVYSGVSNAFGMFVCEDDGINITLNNCGMDAEHFGDQRQSILVLSNGAARRSQAVSLTINGDNTYINSTLLSDCWSWGMNANGVIKKVAVPNPHPLSVTISGGTYMFNPAEEGWLKNATYETPEELYDESNIGMVTIPDGYEVKEITTQQGETTTTLWRVRKEITNTSYVINDDAEGEGKGKNENTEFIITGDGNNQSVGTATTDSVIANYIEVSNDATLTVSDEKVLVVTNGLDVTEGAQLIAEAGSTVIIGEGGVTSENVESIVIEADENGSASFLLDPEVIVNTTPNITIKMTAKGVGYEMDDEEQEFYWFRFAAPVAGIETVGKDPERPTYFYKWNYGADEWSSIDALSDLEPFQGFSLTTNHEGLENVEYTFKGRLAGNQDMDLQFNGRGYNYFGNSYTGYIDVLALVQQLMENDAIDGTVYMWDNTNQRFKDVPLGDVNEEDVNSWKRQIAPMQTFILRQVNTSDPTSTTLNYASAIWANPRYGLVSGPAPAPAPKRVSNDVTKMTIVVTSANGKIDEITFKESDEFSDEYNKGFDAVKFMNERQINLYTTIDNENLGSVATDNIEGKLINMQTVKALNYTMSFENVSGEEYAIRDNVTGAVIAIEEGATYEFVAQPNSVVEGRFEIVPMAKVPTAIENTKANAGVKGIYTIMGQYLGEDFDVLPTGVYVVDGVKIVK